MKREDFQIAALSILAAQGETEGMALKKAVETQSNNGKEIGITLFYPAMWDLVHEGCVSREERPAPTEERQKIRGYRLCAYYAITDDGRKKRISYIQAEQRPGVVSGVPSPALG